MRAREVGWDGKSREGFLEEVASEPMKGKSVIWAEKGKDFLGQWEQQAQRKRTLMTLGFRLDPRELGCT